ncbi:MAG TPA: N-acetyl-gamma-glutamyl-phosphate reductase [Bacteroidia bacterium]|jgi:N-acetyl-gamma-glutamyl-phosphate reductase|nr:N-acetyl-gamma-glutamyl-phosphate reductase [Bacteroidia bacterium]
MQKVIKAGIIGGAGYTGGEAVRLLLRHPQVELAFVESKSQAGKALSDIHTDLIGDTSLHFTNSNTVAADVLFLCLGHGEAGKYLAANPVPAHTRIIDLSQDHRLASAFGKTPHPEWVYGMPESNRELIKQATRIANPGCFATAIQLALLPLASRGKLTSSIHISATTGSTGAGQALSPSTHYTWRNNNLSVYKAFDHQHLGEIGLNLQTLQKGLDVPLHFIPQRGSFTRGILAAVYTTSSLSEAELKKLFEAYYADHPFIRISKSAVDLKQVVNTNKCLLQIEKKEDQVLITSIIDNLLKGASGQAVQNMNLLFGFEEKAGLNLKASVF